MRYCPAADTGAPWAVILFREQDHEYHVDHGMGEGAEERFYIRTNGGGRRNFRLVTAPVADPRPERWVEEIAHRDDVMLGDVEVFATHHVAHERDEGLSRLRITGVSDGAAHHIEFPEPAYEVSSDHNPEFAASTYRFSYQSLVTPPSVFDYDVTGRRSSLLKQMEVLGGYDASRYSAERVHATAADGARIPISLVRRADAPRDGTGPLLLAGYGAYGISLPVMFSSARLSLLDRGVAFAIAHIRGGGELGKRWHDGGRMHAQAQHVHRLHRRRGVSRQARRHAAGPARDRGRQRGRLAHGRRAQHAAGAVPRRRAAGALRRRDQTASSAGFILRIASMWARGASPDPMVFTERWVAPRSRHSLARFVHSAGPPIP